MQLIKDYIQESGSSLIYVIYGLILHKEDGKDLIDQSDFLEFIVNKLSTIDFKKHD